MFYRLLSSCNLAPTFHYLQKYEYSISFNAVQGLLSTSDYEAKTHGLLLLTQFRGQGQRGQRFEPFAVQHAPFHEIRDTLGHRVSQQTFDKAILKAQQWEARTSVLILVSFLFEMSPGCEQLVWFQYIVVPARHLSIRPEVLNWADSLMHSFPWVSSHTRMALRDTLVDS